MQGLWGLYYANDQEAADERDKQQLTGPAAASPFQEPEDAFAKGSLYATRFYSFATDSCFAVALFLAIKAHTLTQQVPEQLQPQSQLKQKVAWQHSASDNGGPKSPFRRDLLMLPFAGLMANQAGQLCEGRGKIYLKEVIGQGAGSIVHRAILNGQEVAFKQAMDGDEDADVADQRLQHEITMLHSPSLRSLMGTAIVPVKASGRLRDGSAFLATRLMSSSAEHEPLDANQEQAILDALALIHQAGILHQDVHTGNVLLPRAHEQLQQPLWVDFGCSVHSRDRDAHACELELCRQMLAAHPKRHAVKHVAKAALRINNILVQRLTSSGLRLSCQDKGFAPHKNDHMFRAHIQKSCHTFNFIG